MDVSVLVQTCDKYEKYWQGFFYYMDIFWDKKINCPIYFCNQNKKIVTESDLNIININAGEGTFVENLKFALEKIKTKYVFYMLEDFWPIRNFEADLFKSLCEIIEKEKIKSLQVSPITKYYSLEKTSISLDNLNLMKFKKTSEWIFNFQSRFWDKELLLNSLCEPDVSESLVSSAITVEDKINKIFDRDVDCYLYQHFWYPLSGVCYRGEFTGLGKELNNNMLVDLYGKHISHQSSPSSSHKSVS